MTTTLSRRGFFEKAGGAGLLAATGAAVGVPPTGGTAAAQESSCLPLGLTREDLVHLFEGPWRGLRAVVEKKVIDVHGHPFQLAQEPRTQADDAEIRARHEYKDFT